MGRLAEILTETTDPPIRGLLIWNCNPLVITPNVEKIRAGVMRDDLFTVVHEQFITDTARYADIVLPATTQIEATDVVPPWGHLWLSWNEAAIEPCGEAVSNSELFRRLARAMGYTEPELFDDDMTVIRESLPGIDVDELRRTGHVRVPYPDDGRPFGDGIFPTASGRVEFVSEALVAMGQPALPTFVPPAGGPRLGAGRALSTTTDDTQAAHPLPQRQLLAPARSRGARESARSLSCAPTMRPAAASATGSAYVCSTTVLPSRCRRASANDFALALCRSHGAGGAAITPMAWSPTH